MLSSKIFPLFMFSRKILNRGNGKAPVIKGISAALRDVGKENYVSSGNFVNVVLVNGFTVV